MGNSKIKLILFWLLNIFGFYFLWVSVYFLAAKQAVSEINTLTSSNARPSGALSISNIFSYSVYLALIALATYAFYWLANKAPRVKPAALIYLLLIAASASAIIIKLSSIVTFWQLLPHWLLNLVFSIPLILLLLKKQERKY